ncbi:RING-H2 finger protein ATL40 [Platanthera guangdongensis]|uniref:RING-H2 finger protein ATL40 n=1 Tax=Platanthera guangdongensis TaxID=2320717 RepID=A0ABR2LEQ8_9ASPA
MASSTAAPEISTGGEQWAPSAFNKGKFNTGSCLMLSAILCLIVILIIISFHLYARYRREYIPGHPRIEIYHSRPAPRPTAVAINQGLSAAAIAALPIFLYRRPESGGAEDCAVCLSSPEEGDSVRVLPDCNHLFHAGCIDAWLQSHSTCPVCRREARPAVVKFEFGVMLSAPRLPERFGGGVDSPSEARPKEGSSGSGRWVTIVDGEHDLERQ